MNKSSTSQMNSTSQAKGLPMFEERDSQPLSDWLSENKSIFLWVFLGIIALLAIASQIINWRTLSAEKDYFQAESTFTQYQKIAANPSESSTAKGDLTLLQTLMERHPELKPKYEGPVAQTLLINGQVAEAEPLVKDIFNRTNPEYLNHYRQYTQATLLIGKGDYSNAIDASLQLKTALDQLEGTDFTVLYTFNLIRLGTLYQQTGQSEAEKDIWNQLLNEPDRHAMLQTANGVLNIGQATLGQYIEERRAVLENN